MKYDPLNHILWTGIFFALICLSSLLSSAVCYGKASINISGQTMGTTYHITLVTNQSIDPKKFKQKIDIRLKQINHIFSTYDPISEISQFNRFRQAGKKFKISSEFYHVMDVAKKLYQLTNGAWDGTLFPLIKLWGFGPGKSVKHIPDKYQIEKKLELIGLEKIDLFENRFLIKRNKAVTLDLASIAKGYGVDQVATLIRNNNIKDYLVEIGGEVQASGFRKGGRLWRIGVNRPVPGSSLDQIYKVVEISDQAFATSGDYRNFFKVGDTLYSHILDPKTGYPVKNGVVSVSVIADNCTLADGLATAIMVLGKKKGIELVNRMKNVECMIVVMQHDGKLADYFSNGFHAK